MSGPGLTLKYPRFLAKGTDCHVGGDIHHFGGGVHEMLGANVAGSLIERSKLFQMVPILENQEGSQHAQVGMGANQLNNLLRSNANLHNPQR